jgi:hypothetical protein
MELLRDKNCQLMRSGVCRQKYSCGTRLNPEIVGLKDCVARAIWAGWERTSWSIGTLNSEQIVPLRLPR